MFLIIRPEDFRIVGIFFCQKGTITHSRIEIFGRRHFFATDPGSFTKFYEFHRIRPRKLFRSRVNLIKFIMNTKRKILYKSPEISCGFHCSRKASRIMISHMYPCLIDICCPLKRCFVIFQNENRFVTFPAQICSITSIQSGTNYNFIEFSHFLTLRSDFWFRYSLRLSIPSVARNTKIGTNVYRYLACASKICR